MLAIIFQKARQEAPCYLVFEDLDSIVSDRTRSFFLNEVDGLTNNDGILMVGSTNHLDRLDPGIAKRPSRFDRKYYFPSPTKEERVRYCEYWRAKLSDNKEIDFPHRLCVAIADITDRFSFAYMQEAFVATLLVIAARKDSRTGDGWNQRRGFHLWQDSSGDTADDATLVDGDCDLNKFILWRVIKVQIKILREGLEEKGQGLPAATCTDYRRDIVRPWLLEREEMRPNSPSPKAAQPIGASVLGSNSPRVRSLEDNTQSAAVDDWRVTAA